MPQRARDAERSSDRVAYHEHRYRGGPPPLRVKRMQLAHEVRARAAGVVLRCNSRKEDRA